MYRNEVTRTVYSALTKIQGANSKQARENFLRTHVENIEPKNSKINNRVGPKYIKFSDQAPNWAKVVPWYGV